MGRKIKRDQSNFQNKQAVEVEKLWYEASFSRWRCLCTFDLPRALFLPRET
jgi:hypothetical protein